MELTDILALSGLNLVLCGLFTFFWRYLLDVRRDRRMSSLEDEVFSIVQTLRSQKAQEVRSDKKERMSEAMAKAALLLKDGKPDKQKLIALASEYPDIALDMVKKFGLKL